MLQPESFNLRESLALLEKTLATDVEARGIRFTFDISDLLPEMIHSDERRIRQVVRSLVSNSLKFTTEGFIAVQAGIATAQDTSVQSKVQISVQDTGKGVAKHDVPKLFSPDHLGDRKPGPGFPGAGVSLYLCKKIANELNGDLTYIEEPGPGARFVFSFSTGVLTGSLPAEERRRPAPATTGTDQLLADRRILLMDDVLDIQMLYSTILRMAGADVDVADNGRIGLSLAENKSYDLIMVDLKMPVMDGFEATRQLRKGGYTRPIIALTSYARPQECQASLDAGCSDHISKPVSAGQLVEKISHWLCRQESAHLAGIGALP